MNPNRKHNEYKSEDQLPHNHQHHSHLHLCTIFDVLFEDPSYHPHFNLLQKHKHHHYFGNCLTLFHQNWDQVGFGDHLHRIFDPFYLPHSCLPLPLSLLRNPSHEQLLHQETSYLLNLGAVEPVPTQHSGKGFNSKYFQILKKNGDWRHILDLRSLNRFVKIQHFKKVTLAAIIPSLDHGDWFSTLDLQDAYFHIAIHRRFLVFTLGQDLFHCLHPECSQRSFLWLWCSFANKE